MREHTLDGRFAPRESLSEGALTRVLAATDADGQAVVIKRLQRHLRRDEACRAMLEHEGRLLAALDDPQLPRLLARGEDPDGPFLVLQRLPGQPLAVTRREPEDAVAVTRGLLRVLGRVHLAAAEGVALHIVHRDVCPANVLVTAAGEVSLVDFGISTSAWRSDPDRGVMKGTRGYMAAEVITGGAEVDARADLFAAGVILTELLTGERLYDGPLPAVMEAVVEGPARGPREKHPAVPERLDLVARRAMARDPSARFASAEDFLAALAG
ncbi:MAG: serine/threonine-protein kinase [Polyangiales bacterium]